jgi:hypothetical protein
VINIKIIETRYKKVHSINNNGEYETNFDEAAVVHYQEFFNGKDLGPTFMLFLWQFDGWHQRGLDGGANPDEHDKIRKLLREFKEENYKIPTMVRKLK